MVKKTNLTKRRDFIKKAGLVTAAGVGATALSAPYGYAATNPIKWRLQTYSGAPLGAHVVLPYLEKEFVVNNLISKELFNGGYGLAQGLPGPLFSFASYIGTAIGIKTNIFQALLLGLGCLFFIFFPGLMLAAITINYWDRLTKLNWFYNGIYGVNASVVGLLFLTFSNILFSNYWDNMNGIILIILSTLFIIFLKFPSWLTVIIMGPLSYFVYSI